MRHRLIVPSVAEDPEFEALISRFPTGPRAANLDGRALLLLSGTELGFLPPEYAAPFVDRGEMVAILPDRFRTENSFYLLTRRSGYREHGL